MKPLARTGRGAFWYTLGMRYNTIVVLGKPGSGKGTQAKLLAEKSGFRLFGASDHLRKFAAAYPEAGERVLNDISHGILVPHWIMSSLWIMEMMDLAQEDGIIFDGAVRKEEEAKLFHDVMTWLGRPYAVVYLAVSDDELRERLSLREGIEKRIDDDGDVITKRLEEYQKNTEPALAFFRGHGTLLEIDGERTVEAIHEDIMARLA